MSNVDHPEHYNAGSIEVLDFIEAWSLDFLTGNVVKYVVRSPYKGREIEDLKKAQFYLSRMILRAEKKEKKLNRMISRAEKKEKK